MEDNEKNDTKNKEILNTSKILKFLKSYSNSPNSKNKNED